MTKVSVIVPIYNSSKYLYRSLECLVNQKLADIEFILVNDGSTDNSLEICNDFKSRDSRFKVINQKNMGVSSARNTGIRVAEGDYLAFMDPDDWIELNMFEKMYERLALTGSKMCMCNYIFEKRNGQKIKSELKKQDIILESEIKEWLIPNLVANIAIDSNSQPILGTVWRTMVNRQYILENRFFFNCDVHYMEDLLWCLNTFLGLDQLVIFQEHFYHYQENENSAVNKYRENFYNSQLETFRLIDNLLLKSDSYPLYLKRLDNRYLELIISCVINESKSLSILSIGSRIRNINRIVHDSKLKEVLETIDFKSIKCTLRKKVILSALKYENSILLFTWYSILLQFQTMKSLYMRLRL